ncbi:cleavage polyadenylation factor subunit fip1 [Purpureocillium takamizusanense]|uniref:Cleavage polyadenylation factor subunit fip1 n=1 Tax=Purpureocillium takamizusanense TaxID=2060973 RepID=A0A9Q8QIP9_9HYPO|nr:cleavage polyadenylation factor subunit fip1 [Purpureocillium takamizusanense]UNI20425.1 cleavage polyadenylation factor subunit fip1 [Purpureocillium takamizusanense]
MAEHEMEMDGDDDLYEPEEPKVQLDDNQQPQQSKSDELEEGEEEDEGGAMDEDDDDSDIDIITERKDGTTAAPPTYAPRFAGPRYRRRADSSTSRQAKYSEIRNIPQRSTSTDAPAKPPPSRKDEPSKTGPNVAAPSADRASAAASKSTIDVNGNPTYPATGKPITQVNIDEDLPDNEKPWRKPGTDISDYFNYGFDEFTWALYAAKQESIRGEFGADAFATNNKKMMEDFNSMMMMGGMGMPGGGGAGGAGGMAGMDGMPPEMQAMMQQMMASGMDPSQMDPSQMNAMMSSMQGGAGAGAQGNQGQNFGGGFGGNQGGYGYDQGMAGGGAGGGGGGRGGFGGGRRGRGRW